MNSLSANMLLPTRLKPAYSDKRGNSTNSLPVSNTRSKRKNQSVVPVRLLLINSFVSLFDLFLKFSVMKLEVVLFEFKEFEYLLMIH